MELRTMMVGHARRLGLFVFATTTLVFSIFFVTRHQIHANERQVIIGQLDSVLASVHYNNDLLGQVRELNAINATGVTAPMPYYIARQANTIVALVFTVVAPDGYSGPIKILIGIKPDGQILAVRVIDHEETPGLGDGIDIKKSSWITQFDLQSLEKTAPAQWKVRKDGGAFDQMTGATITPRAVVKALKDLLLYYQAHKQQLLTQTQDKQHVAL